MINYRSLLAAMVILAASELLSAGTTRPHEGAKVTISHSVPQAVARYLEERRVAAPKEEAPELLATWGPEFTLHFAMFFSCPITEFSGSKSTAWLVAYTIGDLPTQSLTPVYRGALLSDSGHVLFKLDEDVAGEEATVFSLEKGLQAAAISRDGGRPHTGKVTVVTVERLPKIILVYEPPLSGPAWDSKLYFVTPSDGGIAQITVERKVLDFARSRKFTEHLIYRFDVRNRQYLPPETVSAKRFAEVLAMSKQAASIELGPPPYDEQAAAKLVDVTPKP